MWNDCLSLYINENYFPSKCSLNNYLYNLKMKATLCLGALLAANTEAFFPGNFQQPFVAQEPIGGYNILKYMGGYGPYTDRDSFGISRDPPKGCKVEQVVMVHRHGERYPQPADGDEYKSFEKAPRC